VTRHRRLAVSGILALTVLASSLATATGAQAAEFKIGTEKIGKLSVVLWEKLELQGFPKLRAEGYSVAVSRCPQHECGGAPDEEVSRRATRYFAQPVEEEEGPNQTQIYIPSVRQLPWKPINKTVYIGVAPLSGRPECAGCGINWREEDSRSYSPWSEEVSLEVSEETNNKPPAEIQPGKLPYTVEWKGVGLHEVGYSVAISNIARDAAEQKQDGEPNNPARKTKYFNLPASESGTQVFHLTAAMVEELGFSPTDREVWVGVGTHVVPGEQPAKFVENEIKVAVPPGVPVLTSPPNVSGATTRGQPLAAFSGVWEWEPTFAYSWERCDEAGAQCAPVSGLTSESISLGTADVGHRLRVHVVAANFSGSGEATSAPSAVVSEIERPVDSTAPSISGTALRRLPLKASPGAWRNAQGEFAYQWERCDASGAHCAAVAESTAPALTLTEADVGHALRVKVTAQNEGGTTSAQSGLSPVIGSELDAGLKLRRTVGARPRITKLLLTELPEEAKVEIACRGRSCPFAKRALTPNSGHAACRSACIASRAFAAASSVDVAPLFKHRRLRPGTTITVRVLKPGWVGERWVIVIGRHSSAVHRPECLEPESATHSQPCPT
jgi:hypothetical protein